MFICLMAIVMSKINLYTPYQQRNVTKLLSARINNEKKGALANEEQTVFSSQL